MCDDHRAPSHPDRTGLSSPHRPPFSPSPRDLSPGTFFTLSWGRKWKRKALQAEDRKYGNTRDLFWRVELRILLEALRDTLLSQLRDPLIVPSGVSELLWTSDCMSPVPFSKGECLQWDLSISLFPGGPMGQKAAFSVQWSLDAKELHSYTMKTLPRALESLMTYEWDLGYYCGQRMSKQKGELWLTLVGAIHHWISPLPRQPHLWY